MPASAPSSPGVPPASGSAWRVVLIDDHPVFAEALAAALRGEPGFDQIQVTGDPDRAIDLLRDSTAIAVVDVRLGEVDGLSLLARLEQAAPEVRAVILTGHLQRDVVIRARNLGAWGVLPKGIGLDELLIALRRVMAGERLFTTGAAAHAPEGPLSAREIEILQLLANGADVRAVGNRLGLSTHTVRDYVKSARERLGVHTQLAAVLKAASLDLLDLPRQ
ncbi:MAG: response regulator transcription factor [Micropruina sp.]|uniref:response regulator transcription factor n=1 Tax=Micropruina sp. TaxID=2737536 RepID=UPI0039E47051